MSFKKRVHEQCLAIITAKLEAHHQALRELTASAANETKSSAGDKYETARAMLHIEQDNVRRQLSETMAQKAVLDAMNLEACPVYATLASLIETAAWYFFLSIALGKMIVDGQSVIALSPASPLGKKLLKMKVGETIEINGVSGEIISIR